LKIFRHKRTPEFEFIGNTKEKHRAAVFYDKFILKKVFERKLTFRIKISIKTMSNHLCAKFSVLCRFSVKKCVNRLAENLKPSLEMFQLQGRYFVQNLMNGKRIAEIKRITEKNFFPKINDYR
jgi:hypothetical protein